MSVRDGLAQLLLLAVPIVLLALIHGPRRR